MLKNRRYPDGCFASILFLAMVTGVPGLGGSADAQAPTPPAAPLFFGDEEEEEFKTVRVDALVEVGLSPGRNLARANTWAPVSVTLTNLGIEVDGRVEMGFFHRSVSQADPRRYRREYHLPVSLPRRIKGEDPPVKRYTIPVFFESGDGELWANLIVPGKGWLTGVTHLELGRVPLHFLEQEEQLILAVSDRPGEHNHLAVSLTGLPRRRIVDTTPDLLPDVWLSYASADAVLLDTRGLLEIPSVSLQALSSYVAGGGRLVVCGGGSHAALQQDPWPDMLPVTVTGFDLLERPQALEEQFGSWKPLTGSIPVSTGIADDGEVLVADGDLPLIARRRHGLGSVYYVAFNLNSAAIRQWPGRRALARMLFTLDRQPFVLERAAADSEWPVELSLLTGQLVDLPPRAMVGGFLIVYVLVAVPVNYFLLRRIGRRGLVWATIPLLAAGFSMAIFVYNNLTRVQRMTFSAFSILETESGSSNARARTFWSIYSPSRASLSTGFDDPLTLPSEPLSREREPGIDCEPIEFTWGRTLRISHLPVRHQSNRLFASSGVYELAGAIESDLGFDDGGDAILGTIENGTSLDLHQCHLVIAGRGMYLGHLAPGESSEIRMSLREEDMHTIDPAAPSLPSRAGGRELSEASLWVPRRAWTLGSPMVVNKPGLQLVGLSVSSPVHPAGKGDVATDSEATLVAVSLPVRLRGEGTVPDYASRFVSRRICQFDMAIHPESDDLPVGLCRGEWATTVLKPEGIDLRNAHLTRFGFQVDVKATVLADDGRHQSGRSLEPGVVRTQIYNQSFHRWDDVDAIGETYYVDRWTDYLAPDVLEVFVRVVVSGDENVKATTEYRVEDVRGFFVIAGGAEGSA